MPLTATRRGKRSQPFFTSSWAMRSKRAVWMASAVKSASLIPAMQIGLDKEIGSIEPGKAADLVILDKDLEIASVWISHGADTQCVVKRAQ